jgi:uncharacterized membrane protein YgaE (UPF0421/DUF939 family)
MLCKTVNAMSFAEYSYESEFESYESSFVSYTHRQAKTDLERLLKHSADYAQRITLYKKDGKIVKREISEYDQWEKKWRTAE